MSSESHGVLTERTSCAIHAFLFLWPEISSWFPFQIVLWTFYQYEVIVTQYIRLVIQAIQSSVCNAEAPYFGLKMGDQKIESLCLSWWSLLLVVFLFFLLLLFYWSKASGLEWDSKGWRLPLSVSLSPPLPYPPESTNLYPSTPLIDLDRGGPSHKGSGCSYPAPLPLFLDQGVDKVKRHTRIPRGNVPIPLNITEEPL